MPTGDPELAIHRSEVVVDGSRRDHQVGGDLLARLPSSDEPGDLELTIARHLGPCADVVQPRSNTWWGVGCHVGAQRTRTQHPPPDHRRLDVADEQEIELCEHRVDRRCPSPALGEEVLIV